MERGTSASGKSECEWLAVAASCTRTEASERGAPPRPTTRTAAAAKARVPRRQSQDDSKQRERGKGIGRERGERRAHAPKGGRGQGRRGAGVPQDCSFQRHCLRKRRRRRRRLSSLERRWPVHRTRRRLSSRRSPALQLTRSTVSRRAVALRLLRRYPASWAAERPSPPPSSSPAPATVRARHMPGTGSSLRAFYRGEEEEGMPALQCSTAAAAAGTAKATILA